MSDPLATFDDFTNRLGYVPGDDEETRARSLLDDASELIRDVAEKAWDTETVPRRIVGICADVARRAFDNASALTQKTMGDKSQSYDRSKREGGETVYLTRAEERAVRKAAARSSFRAVTLVSPYSGDDEEDDE